MSIIKARFATTHVDRHNDIITLEALKSMVKQMNEKIIPHTIEHDPRIAPIGRIISAEIVELEDGQYAADGIIELFDNLSELKNIENREMAVKQYEPGKFNLIYDRSYISPDDQKIISEIAGILKIEKGPEEEIKKALEPISILAIGGAFVLGAIFTGILNQMGIDIYQLLKQKIKDAFNRKKEEEKDKLLEFAFTVSSKDRHILVKVILTNPSDDNIEKIFENGLKYLDAILPQFFDAKMGKPIKELVFEFDETNLLKFKFGVSSDGLPFSCMSSAQVILLKG